MKASGVMPREIENKEIVDYVNRVAQRVAANSDLKVPLKITLLDSQEINAFALPGGTGFIRFFDKMATTKGYIEGTSWFYDHPPFYDRMVQAQREITFLPQKSELTVQTSG